MAGLRFRQIIAGTAGGCPNILVVSPSPAAMEAALRQARGELPPAPAPSPTRPPAAPAPRASTPRTPTPRASTPSPVRGDGSYGGQRGQFCLRGEITARMAASLERDLVACAGVGVTITVDSQGGDLLAGIAIAKAIKEHGQVTAILKRADSAALAFCAAKQVRAVEGQEYLLHNPTIQIPHSVAVTGPEMHAAAADMESNFRTFSRALERRISDGLFRLLAAADRRLTAEEMVTYGLADSVTRAPAPAPEDDEDDGEMSEEEIAAAVRAGIKRQLDAWKR